MDLRNLPSYAQEFEDKNILNLDKSPEDFLLNLSEEHYDFRRNFPSVDEDSLNQWYQTIIWEDIIELENKKSLFDDNYIEEDKGIWVQTITKELSTSITKQVNSASFIQR